MENTSIIVDMRTARCGNCKVALRDDMATECPVCHSRFDRISSNHAGLAKTFRARREHAGIVDAVSNAT
jgi:Zn finger protein HypA/HybF involved in hydrogenase expression